MIRLTPMTKKAQVAMDTRNIEVLADRGYLSGPQIKQCEKLGAVPLVTKPCTSGSRVAGCFDKDDFTYDPEKDVPNYSAGEELVYRFTTQEKGLALNTYWPSDCPDCTIRLRCTTSKYRRVKRWKHGKEACRHHPFGESNSFKCNVIR